MRSDYLTGTGFGLLKMFWNQTEAVVVQHPDGLNGADLFISQMLLLGDVNFISTQKNPSAAKPRLLCGAADVGPLASSHTQC